MSVLDGMSVRIAFGVTALTFFGLLCIMASSTERATYVTWWRRAMLAFLVAFALFTLDEMPARRFAGPLADLVMVAGAAMVWAGAASLRSVRPKAWQLALGPAAAFLCAALSHPERSSWSGAWCFMTATAVYFGLCSIDTWHAGRSAAESVADRSFVLLARALSIAFGIAAAFYLCRTGVLLFAGAGSDVFQRYFGTGITSLVQLFLLTNVAFSMSSLVTEQKVRDLHRRASRDPLTGLLNRGEFVTLAHARLAQKSVRSSVVVLADLDHFKSVNDRFGHATGDRVIRAFAQACTGVLRAGDLICRFGGEEFVILVPDVTPSDAERLTRLITNRFQMLIALPGFVPTASYGLASTADGADLQQLIEWADQALYRAKESGRDRAVHFASIAR